MLGAVPGKVESSISIVSKYVIMYIYFNIYIYIYIFMQ